ncbi:MAG: 3-methyladenine DNA glycosylase, partial [Mycobacterium sp.]|nr:3-methyladenine DNA glycosylase [Mycobacterium sp.]
MADDAAAPRWLDESDWLAEADAHRRRVAKFLALYRQGRPHPVSDFLFRYYNMRPGQLRCWHPGYGAVLAGADAKRRYHGRRGYTATREGVTVSDAFLRSRLPTVHFVAR